jgi:hypothetical protein
MSRANRFLHCIFNNLQNTLRSDSSRGAGSVNIADMPGIAAPWVAETGWALMEQGLTATGSDPL